MKSSKRGLKIKNVFSAAFILAVAAILLCSCGSKNSIETETAETPHSSLPETTFSLEQVQKLAEETDSQWELLCALLPDYVVYKNTFGMYVYEPVDTDLPLNTYDWSDLSGAKRGIDVSRYQLVIDWEKVAADNVDFAIVQLGYRGYAQEGKLTLDEYYTRNMEGAIANGIPVGVYFITQATSINEACEEADFVIENLKGYDITYPVVIDVEAVGGYLGRANGLTADERTIYVATFCERIKEAGYTPMIYSGIQWFMEEMNLNQLTGIQKWFAMYFNKPYFPYEFQIWQATDSGSVDGIMGNVDIDYCMYNYLSEQE